LKTLRARQYSFSKLTQFSEGNNAQDTPDSNTDYIVPKDTRVSSVPLNRAICPNVNFSPT
jgi:hypothetical protein